MNNVPTIVPKTIGPTPIKKRTSMTSLGLKRKLPSPEKPKEPELTNEEVLQQEIQKLEGIISNMTVEIRQKEKSLLAEINSLKIEVDENKFTVDRFKHNNAHFKFYTGFDSYEMFKLVLEYLQPAANSLIYWGSNTNVKNTKTCDGKHGRSRCTTAETEFFMILIRLQCGFPIEDRGGLIQNVNQ